MHLIWQALNNDTPETIQHSLLSFTAKKFKSDIQIYHPNVLPFFEVNKCDRKYQFWERSPMGIELYSPKVFEQKLNYIHNNPVNAGLCKKPEDYHYSSAKFYKTGDDEFGILTRYVE